MGLEAVLDQVRDTGKTEAAAIVGEAREQREKMLADVRVEGAKWEELRLAEAREQAVRRRVQDLSRAELDAKKIVLSAQEAVLNEVKERTKARLKRIPGAEALRKMLAKHGQEWRSGHVFCSARDAEGVRGIVGERFGGEIECLGGVVIESVDGTRRLDLTYDSTLEDIWNDVVREVATTLWPPK